MIDVNLLPEQDTTIKNDLKVKGVSILVLILTVGITVAVLLGTFSFKTYQENQIANLRAKKESLEAEIMANEAKASQILTLKKKAKGLATVEANKYDFRNAFGYVTDLLPEKIDLSSIRLDSAGAVALDVSSGEGQRVADYIAQITDDSNVRDSKLAGLQVSDDSIIKFRIGGVYGKSKQSERTN